MGRAPSGGKLCLVSASSALGLRCTTDPAYSPCQGATAPLSPSLLHILQDLNEVLARERNPLVLQLDTFGETIGRIPVLRGPSLHVL